MPTHIVRGKRTQLSAIPDSGVLRTQLRNLAEEAAKIRILLHVATEIERIPQRELADLASSLEAVNGGDS
jgi:hypothetical protein